MMTSERRHYDAIVVGSGPGGATVARELSRGSQRVLILEWGDKEPVSSGLGQSFRELFTPGKSLLISPDLMGIVRGITTGGSSIYYCGTAWQPPFEMFADYGVELREEIAEARSEIPIAPLAKELIGPKCARMMQSAQELGFDWQPLEKFFYQDRCTSTEPMGMYFAPSYEAKWNARMWIDEAIELGAVLQTGARVHEVLREGTKATGVVYTRDGKTLRAYADTIIVAAGGIGSPMILRASGIAGAGYDFFVDPLILVQGEIDDVVGPPDLPMSTGVNCEADGYMMTDLCTSLPLHVATALRAGRIDKLGAKARARTSTIMVKAKDELGGRLTDRGQVDRRLAPEDAAKLQHGYERAREILANAGARTIYKGSTLAAHPGGTVKIGELLDENLQTEFTGLYVCDCSVIPQAWGIPPTLSLLGLGKRLARHLLDAQAHSSMSTASTAGDATRSSMARPRTREEGRS